HASAWRPQGRIPANVRSSPTIGFSLRPASSPSCRIFRARVSKMFSPSSIFRMPSGSMKRSRRRRGWRSLGPVMWDSKWPNAFRQTVVTGAISVNSDMETNVLGIFAAGNCAETFCAIRRRPVLHYIGTVAAKQGRVAGDNIAARRTKFVGAIGTTVVKVCDLAVARTGLCSDDAAAESIPVVSARIEAWDRAAYYPTARKLWVKLIAERESRKLVGAQVAGYGDASKRIDVACAAITSGMRVDELVQLDLAYSPPYGNLWDPLLIEAEAVLRKTSM